MNQRVSKDSLLEKNIEKEEERKLSEFLAEIPFDELSIMEEGVKFNIRNEGYDGVENRKKTDKRHRQPKTRSKRRS